MCIKAKYIYIYMTVRALLDLMGSTIYSCKRRDVLAFSFFFHLFRPRDVQKKGKITCVIYTIDMKHMKTVADAHSATDIRENCI